MQIPANQFIKKTQAFTLLEILIALAIFAVVAVTAAVGLRTVINTREHIKGANDRLKQIITAVTIMRRDITQMVARPVKDTSGEMLPALSIPSLDQFEFTRAGYTNPLQISARSTLQRVGYTFKKNAIYRVTWPVLDRAPHTESVTKKLLSGVKRLNINFVNQEGQRVEVWSTTYAKEASLPRAMILSIDLQDLGPLNLVFPIRGQNS